MKHRLFALLLALRAILDRHFAIKLRFAMAQVHISKQRAGNHVIPSPTERAWLLSIGAEIDHNIYDALGIVTKQTYKRWLREAKRGQIPLPVGRKKKISESLCQLTLRMLKDNPIWGKRRISGELLKLTFLLSPTSIGRLFKDRGLTPPPDKTRKPSPAVPWNTFLDANMHSIAACDFFSIKKRFWWGSLDMYCLFFIHLGSRRVWASPVTRHPTEVWVIQQARNVSMWVEDQGFEIKHLIRDNDAKFTPQFDHFFSTTLVKGTERTIIKTAICAPDMNAYAEVFVGTIKRECLDYFCMISETQANHIIQTYIKFYNHHRPHQGKGIDNRVLDPAFTPVKTGEIKCQLFLGGLLKSYYREAA